MDVKRSRCCKSRLLPGTSITHENKMETRGLRMLRASGALQSTNIETNEKSRLSKPTKTPKDTQITTSPGIVPSYESTKGLSAHERETAIQGWSTSETPDEFGDPTSIKSLVPYSDSSEEELESNPEFLSQENNISNTSDSLFNDDTDSDPDYIPSSIQTETDSDSQPLPSTNETLKYLNNVSISEELNDNFNGKKEQTSNNSITINKTNCESVGPTISIDREASSCDVIPIETNALYSQDVHLKRVRKKSFCFYCEKLVTTFARHITRNHTLEIEVQQIISKPMKSKERKNLIDVLRKKGNYLYNTTIEPKPVRTPSLQNSLNSLLPCTYCLGFYSKKQLWRHRKKCSQNPGNSSNKFAQTAGQNYLLKDTKIHAKLYEQVFPRMRADLISFAAKKDPLICAFGSRYLLTHRDKHQINVTSRKMRELAKLLMEAKKIEPKIRNLLHALKPEYFDVLVEATKVAASYDADADRYNAPTYAMNISTSLKECCEIGILHALKKKHCFEGQSAAEAEAELQTTILLLKSNWKFEISHHAANNLHFNKMNKITMVPLASDLKMFRDYLNEKGTKAASMLSTDQNSESAYRLLVEITYCRVLLLCRKRVGELQRLPLSLYEQTSTTDTCYEEFQNVVNPIEMMLIRKFKRVVIQGKRRVTPVLFSFEVQKHIDLLIKFRHNFLPAQNIFLFGNANTTNPITGYKVLQKHSKIAGLKRPEAVTSRSLRKHLATISQLFQLNDQDIEQLASFMGHTSSIHRKEYRLPDDVYQTAKIAKLLLTMESGEGAKNKGKSLDDIEVNLEEDLLQITPTDYNDEGSSDEEEIDDLPIQDLTEEKHLSRSRDKVPTKTTKKREFTKWSDEEKCAVFAFFKAHISKSKPPRKHECEALMSQHPTLFKNKTWPKMKVLVQNAYTKKTSIILKKDTD